MIASITPIDPSGAITVRNTTVERVGLAKGAGLIFRLKAGGVVAENCTFRQLPGGQDVSDFKYGAAFYLYGSRRRASNRAPSFQPRSLRQQPVDQRERPLAPTALPPSCSPT